MVSQEIARTFLSNASRYAWRRPQSHKKALLKDLYSESGLQQMLAIKQALDPEGKLAQGNLF